MSIHYISAQRLLRETWSSSCQISSITGLDTAAERTMRVLVLTVTSHVKTRPVRNHHLTVARCRRLRAMLVARLLTDTVFVCRVCVVLC